MKTPITKESIRNHFTYAWWKYALLVVLAVFGWNIVYTMTAYRPPEEKKIILGVYGYGNNENVNVYMEQVRQEQFPEMEDMSCEIIAADETYGDMILTTRIAARECDIYGLTRKQFQQYAAQSGFMALEEALPDLVADLEAAGISLSRGWRTDEETGEKHLFGIPCQDLPGLAPMLKMSTDDLFLSIFFDTGNNENVIRFFDVFVRDMLVAPEAREVSE